MALDISGIRNVEFYSEHYLEAVLENDLKDVFRLWSEAKKEEGKPLPFETLKRQDTKFFKAMAKAESERDITTRWELAREFHVDLLEALGFEYQPGAEPLGNNEVCPVLLALEKDGNPFLWVVDAPFTEQEEDDPFDVAPMAIQLPNDLREAKLPHENSRKALTWREILDTRLFRIENAPRWVIFLAGREVYLVERNKWPQGRYLAFDLAELFRRSQATALKAAAGLLHKDVLAPDTGVCLHDSLEEKSHKHAYAVSSDLKYGVRRAVELLGNEAVYYRREVQKKGVFDSEDFTEEILTSESLTWLYRLLFLFYVEARGGELGIVPMNAEIYREGYSLEKLRDLELVDLTSEHARNGYYLHDSLRTLFKIVNEGYGVEQGTLEMDFEQVMHDSMMVQPLNSPLFDNSRFIIIKNIRIRNFVLQEILQLLSLSAEKRRKTRGRISYAQLGINQLGSVYEGLLSYSGFFAKEDLYEVAAEKDCKKLSGKSAAERDALKTYFVPTTRISHYKEGEIVRDESNRKIVHKKGTFIFRLAGRNREKSASYYTPEVLTKCLVKYALKELLWEADTKDHESKRKKTADEILLLTICEPAMGSSAFLIEAVDQLADAYLEARQEELNETISPEDYQHEKRRVKARLATNNCYGVDLNPTAVELAKTSLWLATLYEGGKCPWFGLRLATGNSLVGARREVYKTTDVTRKGTKNDPNWLGLVPEPVPLNQGAVSPPVSEDWERWTPPPRPKGTIYHFLLPSEGMAAFEKDKIIKELAPGSIQRIREWRKEFCKPFTRRDAERLELISDSVDRLFAQIVRERVLAIQETSDYISVWGESSSEEDCKLRAGLLVRDQEDLAASLESENSAYQRLKLAMDAWCALWFWPIQEADLLPDRATWLAEMELILKGKITRESSFAQGDLFAALASSTKSKLALGEPVVVEVLPKQDISAERLERLQALSDTFRDSRTEYFGECGFADIEIICKEDSTLRAARRVAEKFNFHHWELRFAEVFAVASGFDLVLGNPPWVRLEWNEIAVIGDLDPSIFFGNADTSEIRKLVFNKLGGKQLYLSEFAEMHGIQKFLGSTDNYPLLHKTKLNLYKCFITKSWAVASKYGLISLLHEEGLYEDTTGVGLRKEMYTRLFAHYQFENGLKFFPDVGHKKKFSINFSRKHSGDIGFVHMAALMHPATIDESWRHDGRGPVPTAKAEDGNWNLRGHRNRILNVDFSVLQLMASVYNPDSTTEIDVGLPIFHDARLLQVLRSFALSDKKLGTFDQEFSRSQMLNETIAQREGTLLKKTKFPDRKEDWVLSGPHIEVGNPFGQTPNENCKSKGDYSSIDLLTIDSSYLPRTNFIPACDLVTYSSRLPSRNGCSMLGFFRYVHREMVNPVAERTLIAAILPPGAAHIDTLYSIAFDDERIMLLMAGFAASIPLDFFVRTTGAGHIKDRLIFQAPLLEQGPLSDSLLNRTLALNCVSSQYRDLWERHSSAVAYEEDTGADRRLASWRSRAGDWTWNAPLRNSFERRFALVEIDVLVALSLGLSLDELIATYRGQFPVLHQYERYRLYDQHGRIVPTSKTAAGNPAVSLVELAATLKEQAGFDVNAEYHPDGSNTQELRNQKIRLGKKEAGVLGVSERCTMRDLLADTEVRWSDEFQPEGRTVHLVGIRYTDPGLEPRMERVYPTPWTRCDREADYRQAWAEFERQLGKKMPEGAPL